MAILPPTFRQRYFSASGLPLSGGKLFTYQAGTVTPLATYTDATEASANTNPIILDANGECNLWLGGFAYKIVLTDSNDVVQWTQDNVNQGSILSSTTSDYVENLGITAQPSSNDLLITLRTADGGSPSPSSPVRVGFRSSSLASGLASIATISGPLTLVISRTSTLGHLDGVASNIYVYLINNAGTAELAVSSSLLPENAFYSTTVIAGGVADSFTGFYSTTARLNVPVRLIAKLVSNQTTAGLFATAPTAIYTGLSAGTIGLNYVVSSDFGAPTSSTSFSDVDGSSVQFQCTGRPVKIEMVGRVGSSGAGFFSTGNNGTCGGTARLVRASTTLTELGLETKVGASTISNNWPGNIHFIDTPGAGIFTYKMTHAKSSVFGVNDFGTAGRLLVYEL